MALATANFINGDWQPAQDGATNAVLNPATGEVLGELPASSATDVDAAVQAASAVFGGWAGITLREHSEILHRLADMVEVDLLANLVLTRIVLGLLLVEYQTRNAPPYQLADIAGELPGFLANLLRWGKLDPRATTEALHHQLDTTER
jgi:hypothetical protein